MSDLRPTGTKIKLGNRELSMRLTLNAIDQIQDKLNISIDKLGDAMSGIDQIKNIRFILTTMINEDIDCRNDDDGTDEKHVDESFVGRHIDVGNLKSVTQQIFACVLNGSPEGDEDDENPPTGQQS